MNAVPTVEPAKALPRMMNIDEVAETLGIGRSGVESLVWRKQLVRRGRRVHRRFWVMDVLACKAVRGQLSPEEAQLLKRYGGAR